MQQLLIFAGSFVVLWLGAGLVVNSIELFSKTLKLPAFLVSFFVLGFMTTLPEMGLGISSVINDTPEVYVGTLIGGVIVIFLLVIPLLAMLSNGISLKRSFPKSMLGATMVVIAAPSIVIIDQKLTVNEGIALILLYIFLFLLTDYRQQVSAKIQAIFQKKKKPPMGQLLLKISIGVLLILGASQSLVQSSLQLSQALSISPFIFSLLLLAVGTNLPELSVCFRALWSKKQDIAFGDYLGSAASNTLTMGGLTVVRGSDVILPNHSFHRFIFVFLALALFLIFARSDQKLNRLEGLVLIVLYISFVVLELSL